MPPKLAPKPTLGADPGLQLHEAHHGTRRPYLPERGPIPSSSKQTEQVDKVIGTFYWYKYRDRPMTRDEVKGMLSFVYDITNAQFVNNRCKRIEEQLLNYGATEYENEINTNDPDRIRAEVDEMFDSYCEKYKDANEIRDVLKGLKVRMPHLGNFKSKVPLWEGKEIRVDQLCSLYVLANWCKTDEDRLLSVDEVCEIAATEIFRTNIRQNAAFVKRLRGPGYDLADRVHDLLESHEDIKSHFGNKALELYYSKHAGRQVPPLSIPGLAQDPLTTTTSAIAALIVTAGPSRHSNPTPRKTTSESEWSDFHDFDSKSASKEASPPPEQSTTDDPHYSSKRRARESNNSSSPGSEAGPSKGPKKSKGKGKEKEREREPDSKRQRGSGYGQKK